MKSVPRQALGRLGESLAAEFLEKLGYSIIERNFRTPYGEIDLITKQGDVIIFTEVKTRSSSSLGPPEISITRKKSEHIRNAAEYYIQQHPDMSDDWRIDVISVQMQSKNIHPKILHFENAIT
jgi:putative endonuclease